MPTAIWFTTANIKNQLKVVIDCLERFLDYFENFKCLYEME